MQSIKYKNVEYFNYIVIFFYVGNNFYIFNNFIPVHHRLKVVYQTYEIFEMMVGEQ